MRHSKETALALQDQSRSIHVRQIVHANNGSLESYRILDLTTDYYEYYYHPKGEQ